MSNMDDVRIGKALIEGQIQAGAVITLEQAAAQLSVTKEMIRKFIRQGKCYHFTYGRKVYVASSDIEKLQLRDKTPGRKKVKSGRPKAAWKE